MVPIYQSKTEEMDEALIEHIVTKYCVPDCIIINQDSTFMSSLMNYLLMTLDGKTLQGLFEHEGLKPAILRTSEGNVSNLVKLKQLNNAGLTLTP